jgi:hypothetical protein
MHVEGISDAKGGLRVCGALGQCTLRDPRALKNVVACSCVLEALLLIRINEDREHLKALGAFHLLLLDKLRARLARGPRSCMAYFTYALVRPWSYASYEGREMYAIQ